MSLNLPEGVDQEEVYATQFVSGYMTWGVNKDGTVKEEMNAEDGDAVIVHAYGKEYQPEMTWNEETDQEEESPDFKRLKENLLSHGWSEEAIKKMLRELGLKE